MCFNIHIFTLKRGLISLHAHIECQRLRPPPTKIVTNCRAIRLNCIPPGSGWMQLFFITFAEVTFAFS